MALDIRPDLAVDGEDGVSWVVAEGISLAKLEPTDLSHAPELKALTADEFQYLTSILHYALTSSGFMTVGTMRAKARGDVLRFLHKSAR